MSETTTYEQHKVFNDDLDSSSSSVVLLQDGVQSVDDIAKVLNSRVRPKEVQRKIDHSKKYSIEDVYENEIRNRLEQILPNLAREQEHIADQIDKKNELYYKGNDTYTNLLENEANEIKQLIEELEQHELLVKIEFLKNSVKLTAQKEEEVKRDGIVRTEIREVCAKYVPLEVFEGKDGYRLSVEKIKADENAFHDKQLMKKLKAEQEKKDLIKEESEEPLEEVVEEKSVEPQQEPKKEEKAVPKSTFIEPEGVNNIINSLGSFKGENLFKEPEPEERDWMDDLIDSIVSEGTLTEENMEEVLFGETAELKTEQKPINEQPAFQYRNEPDFDAETIPQYGTVAQPQTTNLNNNNAEMMTEHEMKVKNFNIAAQEVSQRMLDCYAGNKQKLEQDEDYVRLMEFVEKTNKKQAEFNANQPKEDWENDEENREYRKQDFNDKRQSFEKLFDQSVFDSMKERANGIGF